MVRSRALESNRVQENAQTAQSLVPDNRGFSQMTGAVVREVRMAGSLSWPLLTTKWGFFSACAMSSHRCLPCADLGLTIEGGLSSSCSKSGDNLGERLWR